MQLIKRTQCKVRPCSSPTLLWLGSFGLPHCDGIAKKRRKAGQRGPTQGQKPKACEQAKGGQLPTARTPEFQSRANPCSGGPTEKDYLLLKRDSASRPS